MIPTIPQNINYLRSDHVLVGKSVCGCITSIFHPRHVADVLDFETQMKKSDRTVDYLPTEVVMEKMYQVCPHIKERST